MNGFWWFCLLNLQNVLPQDLPHFFVGISLKFRWDFWLACHLFEICSSKRNNFGNYVMKLDNPLQPVPRCFQLLISTTFFGGKMLWQNAACFRFFGRQDVLPEHFATKKTVGISLEFQAKWTSLTGEFFQETPKHVQTLDEFSTNRSAKLLVAMCGKMDCHKNGHKVLTIIATTLYWLLPPHCKSCRPTLQLILHRNVLSCIVLYSVIFCSTLFYSILLYRIVLLYYMKWYSGLICYIMLFFVLWY